MSSSRAPDLGRLFSRPTLLVEVLSRHYPIPRALLRRYAQVWDWAALSSNTAIEWDLEWILEHRERWDWPRLCCNPALPCSVELLRELVASGKCDWLDFRRQPRVFERADLFALCLPHWNAAADQPWARFPEDEYGDAVHDWFGDMPWGPELRACAAELVERVPGLRWDLFSAVEGFPWTIEIIDRHRDALDWTQLSQNHGLPWSLELLETFEQHWDWRVLGFAPCVAWTTEWIDRFADSVHWAEVPRIHDRSEWNGRLRDLINCPTVVWTPEFFERHRAAIERHVAQLSQRHYRLELLTERYWTHFCEANNWSAELVRHLAASGRVPWANLCRYGRGLWTRAFIDEFRPQLELGDLVQNPEFPWSELLDDFAEQLSYQDWQALSRNPGFAPSSAALQRYEDRWERAALMKRLPLTFELVDAFATHYLAISALVENPHLDAEIVAHLRDRWDTQWGALATRPDAIALVEAHPELPWDVVELAYEHGAGVCAWIGVDTVEQLAQRLVTVEREPRNLQLEQLIARAPTSTEHHHVYADWLEERGDPHAMLIRAMLDGCDEAAIEALVREYERTLQADDWTLRWRDGFVREAYFGLEWRRALGRRAFRFVEALNFHSSTEPLVDADFELLRPLDRLRKLGISQPGIVRSDAFSAVPMLEYLRLEQGKIEELSQLAGREALRHVLLPWTPVRDLGPLAEVPNLTWLQLEHSKVVDLSPLRACVRLVELDIRSTAVSDLSPLHELPALRRVFLHDSAADEREVLALQRAQPELRVFSSVHDRLRYHRQSPGWFGVPEDC